MWGYPYVERRPSRTSAALPASAVLVHRLLAGAHGVDEVVHGFLVGHLRVGRVARSLWSLTLDPGPLGGPQFFINVNTWGDFFGPDQVNRMIDALTQHPAFEPIRDSVRERGIEKLHRVRIADAFESDQSVAVLRDVWDVAMRSREH